MVKTLRIVGEIATVTPYAVAWVYVKVALLLIEESRQAWRVLMQPGRAVADGLPARFVSMLDALEAGLMQRFPRAFEFIRPGFDTGLASVNSAQVAEALKKAAAGSN